MGTNFRKNHLRENYHLRIQYASLIYALFIRSRHEYLQYLLEYNREIYALKKIVHRGRYRRFAYFLLNDDSLLNICDFFPWNPFRDRPCPYWGILKVEFPKSTFIFTVYRVLVSRWGNTLRSTSFQNVENHSLGSCRDRETLRAPKKTLTSWCLHPSFFLPTKRKKNHSRVIPSPKNRTSVPPRLTHNKTFARTHTDICHYYIIKQSYTMNRFKKNNDKRGGGYGRVI